MIWKEPSCIVQSRKWWRKWRSHSFRVGRNLLFVHAFSRAGKHWWRKPAVMCQLWFAAKFPANHIFYPRVVSAPVEAKTGGIYSNIYFFWAQKGGPVFIMTNSSGQILMSARAPLMLGSLRNIGNLLGQLLDKSNPWAFLGKIWWLFMLGIICVTIFCLSWFCFSAARFFFCFFASLLLRLCSLFFCFSVLRFLFLCFSAFSSSLACPLFCFFASLI